MGRNWADRLILAGVFLIFFGGYLLFLKEAAANQQQQIFRISVFAAGVLLSLLGGIWKAIAGNRGS